MTSGSPIPSQLSLAADIVAAYVANNSVSAASIPGLIRDVHTALSELGGATAPSDEKPVPAVSVRRSLTPDYLISLEDGRQYKSLKRHLAVNGLTPMTYRQKWGLPLDYPMVAPNYAKQRSDLARAIGLGRRGARTGEEAPAKTRGSRSQA